jgi:hypothetical protein
MRARDGEVRVGNQALVERRASWILAFMPLLVSCVSSPRELADCAAMGAAGFRPIASERDQRFLGKVQEATARCRGGKKAVTYREEPWVDWSNYWGTGDAATRKGSFFSLGHFDPNCRGIDGALLDLEYQRIELIKFNLFDNSGTYSDYVRGRDGVGGPALKVWGEMRLPRSNRYYEDVGGDGPQLCSGELIRFRNVSGICNDVRNPAMGSTNMLFARNVEFASTFPDLDKNALARNRHGTRIDLLTPDPQVISRKLFTRQQRHPEKCNAGAGLDGDSPDAECDYVKADFFNVLAAFWIQFMTHDWFSHLSEGHNDTPTIAMGCTKQLVGGAWHPLSRLEAQALGCRPDDVIDKGFVADDTEPETFAQGGTKHLTRAYRTTRNTVTAWWDASQIYGYDETSRRRVKRDPRDRAKLLLQPIGVRPGAGEKLGYLPLLARDDPKNPVWEGQEATAFADNWSIGMSFFHNVFAREHDVFVETFRQRAATAPDADSGLRKPSDPDHVVRYRDVTDDELFEVARLVVAAEIAKIHTIEWTTQLLYDEPLFLGMNANWHGLLRDQPFVSAALAKLVADNFGKSDDVKKATQWYSVFAAGAGIVGLGSHVYADDAIFAHYDPRKIDLWSLRNPDHVNGGVNHFGSPFNFPEEFVTVYRLHALVPDLIEFRKWDDDPNAIQAKTPVVRTFRGQATRAMHEGGLANWAISMGRQRLGLLTLQNDPQFLQNLPLRGRVPSSPTNTIDVTALDLIRDRERGVPRFNEFRRQYGLKQLTSFEEFIDRRLDARVATDPGARKELEREQALVKTLREVYGQHECDASKIITASQRNDDGTPINDCLGHPDGNLVDNIEDVDTVVGMLAEFARPHGFAISETQFQVFILNASRRLFSDRFFTSSLRPEFYAHLGIAWVGDNGPDGKVWEKGEPNGHRMEVSPLKRVLLRTIPELRPELEHVVNVFDPWARDRGEYYSLDWKPRKGAESDPAFRRDS